MSKRRTYQSEYDYDDEMGSSYDCGSYEYTFGSVPDSPVTKSFEQHQYSREKSQTNNSKSPDVDYKSPVVTRKPLSKKSQLRKLKKAITFLQENGFDMEDPRRLEEIARRNNFDLEKSLADMKYFQFNGEDDIEGGDGGVYGQEEYYEDGYGEFLPPHPPNDDTEGINPPPPILEETPLNRPKQNHFPLPKPSPLQVPSQEGNPRAFEMNNNNNNTQHHQQKKKKKKNGNKNNNLSKPSTQPKRKASPQPPKKVNNNNNNKKRTPLPDMSKTRLSVLIVGHVDAGKSTLVGQILVQCGVVDPKILRAYQKQSNDIGKGSFYLAWITDEDREERSRGVTVHLGIKQFETEHKLVTILDSPGHRDFVPNMIMGAAQADVGVLVIDAVKGAFEAGFRSMGQTREHVLVASCLGVKNWIVVVNKMDMCDWEYKRFHEIEEMLTNWMVGSLRLKKRNIRFIPISGLGGVNVTTKVMGKPEKLCSWYDGNNNNKKCLLDLIDEMKPMKRMTNKPLRMSIHDVFKTKYSGVFVTGTVDAGVIYRGDRVEIHPLQEIVTVKRIKRVSQEIEKCFAGDYVELNISGNTEYQNLQIGQILCPPSFPISYSQKFKVTMITFDIEFPIIKGTEVIIHLLNKMVSGNIYKVLSLMNNKKEVKIKRPRFVPKNSMSNVVITTQNPICLETFSKNKSYGTLIIRKDGNTIASAIVTKIFPIQTRSL